MKFIFNQTLFDFGGYIFFAGKQLLIGDQKQTMYTYSGILKTKIIIIL